ncbi:MAG: metal-dependent hydrolase [Novosphingobium sp.]
MPTAMTHAVVPLAAAIGLGAKWAPRPLTLAAALFAILPDADVVGFRFGIAYADMWGHRGATHSLAIAAILASLAVALRREWRSPFAWTFLFLAAASHGLLDMLTDGGRGVALFWPFENSRHFFPARPIRVSPIGAGFFSARGLETVVSEMVLIWLPVAIAAATGMMLRKLGNGQSAVKSRRR